MIPENIRDDARVAAQLGNALSLMNSAVEGSDLPSVSVYPTGTPCSIFPTKACNIVLSAIAPQQNLLVNSEYYFYIAFHTYLITFE